MSDDQHASPQANIRNWLSKATHGGSAKPKQSRITRSKRKARGSPRSGNLTRSPHVVHHHNAKDNILKHRRHQPQVSPQTNARHNFRSRKTYSHNMEEATSGDEHLDGGLPKRLSLQGPFRTFGLEYGLGTETDRPRKRQRRSISLSSDLQPAFAENHERVSEVRADVEYLQPVRKSRTMAVTNNNVLLSGGSDHLICHLSPPKKLLKAYERRQRCKTRENRYEINGDKRRGNTAQLVPITREQARDKGRHKKKSGKALMHDFNAPNISNERLTVSIQQC